MQLSKKQGHDSSCPCTAAFYYNSTLSVTLRFLPRPRGRLIYHQIEIGVLRAAIFDVNFLFFHFDLFRIPDFFRVLLYRTVAGKLTHICHIQY